jgi:hypothetical protein
MGRNGVSTCLFPATPFQNWRCPVSFNSSHKKPGLEVSARSTFQAGKRYSACGKRALRATIEEYILEHRSQNHSPKTMVR